MIVFKNILYVVPGLPTKFRPHFMPFISEQLKALSDRSDITLHVFVCFPFFHYVKKEYFKYYRNFFFEKPLRINSDRIKIYPVWFMSRPLKIFNNEIVTGQIAKKIKKLILKNKINFNFIHGHFGDLAPVCNKLSQQFNKEYILTEHASDINPLIVKFGKAKLIESYKNAKSVICVSEHLKSKIAALDKSIDNLVVVPNGIDISKYVVKKKHTFKNRYIFIGHLIERKGIKILLEACSILKSVSPGFVLNIYGKGELRKYMIDYIEEKGLVNNIILRGIFSNDKINEILLDSDVLILPSYKESFGVVVIEALATGLPVIATECGGPETIIKDDSIGEIINVGDSNALYSALTKVADKYHTYNPKYLSNFVNHNYGWNVIIQRIFDIYKK